MRRLFHCFNFDILLITKKNEKMKKYFLVTMFFMAIVVITNAQQPVPNGNNGIQPPPPPPGKERGMRPLPTPDQQLQKVATYQGKVVKMSANDDYLYDGFYLLTNGDSLLVKFPPHLGSQITGAVKTGSAVSVNGVLHIAPMGEKEIRMLSLTSGKNIITDTALPAATPPLETYITGNGKITKLQTDREGRIKGFIVDDKTILHIRPHVATQLGTIAQTGAGIAYTGTKKANKQGEVSTADYTIVHCNTITVNGQQYVVGGPGGRP